MFFKGFGHKLQMSLFTSVFPRRKVKSDNIWRRKYEVLYEIVQREGKNVVEQKVSSQWKMSILT